MFSPYQKIAFDQRLRCYVDQKTIGMLKVTNTKMYHSGSQFSNYKSLKFMLYTKHYKKIIWQGRPYRKGA